MPAVVEVRINQAALRHLLTDNGGDLGRNLTLALYRVRNGAVARCPVVTGRLRASVSVDGPRATSGTDMEGTVGSDVEYAGYVHNGTRYMAGRPFLTDALTEVLG